MAVNKSKDNYFHEQTSSLLGLGTESIGKTLARQEFLPLIADLAKHPRVIEITDRDAPVAVLLSYEQYASLVSQLSKLTGTAPRKKLDLMGSVAILGGLEAASKEIAEEVKAAIDASAANL